MSDSIEMQITLMRHGKPSLAQARWMPPSDMAQWIDDYNRAEVADGDIPAQSVEAAMSACTIVASPAPRAQSSVRALGHMAHTTDAIFAEAELPFALWRAPLLPPKVWAAFFRLLWFCGYSRAAASLHSTRKRANAAAERLVSAASHGPVLLVGHGIMNRLIGKALQQAGWIARTRHDSRHWGMTIYCWPA